jgi:sugar phosphate isomerase/epimerase
VITQLPDPDLNRAADRFGRLCDLAQPLGLGIDLEFVYWTETPDLSRAVEVLRAVDRPNAGLLVDILHFERSNSSITELLKVPTQWLSYAHVCDAPKGKPETMEQLLYTCRSDRRFPGEGGLDVRGILACLPQNIPYALEIPGDSLAAEVGLEEYARRALQASRRHIDGVSGEELTGRYSLPQRSLVTI